METEQRWDDDRFTSELASALAPPDVPPGILQAARAVFTWRMIDAQLAELTYDSAVLGEALVGVRGTAAAPRTLTFEAAGILLDVDITKDALVGQILPAEPGVLEVYEALGTRTQVPVNNTGGFRVHPLPRSAFRLVYTSEQGTRLTTDHVRP